MKFTRILAMLLIVVMIIPMVVACNDSEEPAVTTTAPSGNNNNDPVTDPVGGTTTGTGSQPSGPATDANGYELDDLDPSLNYDGYKFNFLAWQQSTKEYDVEDASGDDVDSALYERNRKVEDRLGIELIFNEIPGGSSAVNDFIQTANTSISNNSGAYDAVAAYTRCAGVLSTYGVYKNLYDVENINLEKPWWPSKIVETNTVAGRIFCATGDVATSLIYQMEFMIINDDYATDLNVNVDELQELALAGGWTLDKLFEVCSNAYQEIDGKSGKSTGDRFGLYLRGHALLDLFYVGSGLSYVDTLEDGLEISADYNGAVSLDLLGRIGSKLKRDNSFFYSASGHADIALGNSLIYTVTGSELATTLREAAFAYSILPAPKYNAEQETYNTAVQFPHSMYSIPVDVDVDRSGAVLECMASESYRQVTPVLFEKCFKYKYATDTVDSQVLTIVRDSTVFDLGRTFFEVLGGDTNSPVRTWRNLLAASSTKLAGQYSANIDFWTGKLLEIYTSLSEIE